MRSLVTGGAGFIGSHLVERLLHDGDEVLVLDNLSTGTLDNLDAVRSDQLRIEVANVHEPSATESAVRRFRPERIFHLAAQVSVPNSMNVPLADFQTNALGATVLFEAAAKYGVERIVFSSTGGAIYGDAEEIPTSENHSPLPLSPYGQHKLLAETAAGFYSRQRGISVTTLRFANVYGPRQGGSGESGVISLFTGAAIEEKPVTIYGDGEQTRDFVFVRDVVDALTLASEVENGGGPYNIGTSTETSINDLVAEIQGLGIPIDSRYAAGRDGEVQRSALSAGLASRELGWQPKTPFRKGLKLTIDEMKEHPRIDRQKELLCIDVGGSTITKAVITDPTYVHSETIRTVAGKDALLDLLAELVNETEDWCLSLPGTVSGRRFWTGSSAYGIMEEVVDLQSEFQGRGVSTPLLSENDVYALARGAALENLSIKRLAVINLGNGVGGALDISGWPEKGIAQEMGHLPIPGNDSLCLCGQRGCIETSLAWWSLGKRSGLETPELFAEAVLEKDPAVLPIYGEARASLLFLLKMTKLMLSPEAIMLSGGALWSIWERELDALEDEMNAETIESPGSQGILLASTGPGMQLRGLYDLARNEYAR